MAIRNTFESSGWRSRRCSFSAAPHLPKGVELATALLRDHPEQSISEIAYRCAYEPQTMYRHFHAVLGVSPGQVRRASVPDKLQRAPQELTILSHETTLPYSRATSECAQLYKIRIVETAITGGL